MTDYGNSLRGVGEYAWDAWNTAQLDGNRHAERESPDQYLAGLYAGRMQSFAGVLRQITGRDPTDPRCREVLDTI